MEAEKAELKSILRGLLISSPTKMTVRDLSNDFARQEGREFPYHKYGFRTFIDYLKTIKDTVVLSGSQPIYVSPVVKESTAHVNEMVLNQKISCSKKSSYKAVEKLQRRRGWVPIVIPPDPAKTLPTLLDIKVPIRNKHNLHVPEMRRAVTGKTAYHSFRKLKADTEYKNLGGGDSVKCAGTACEKDTANLENILQPSGPWKKAEVCNSLGITSECTNTVVSEPTDKWKEICGDGYDENKGYDDSLYQKYLYQNLSFKSINNIEEWFPTETPEPSLQSEILSPESKDAGNNFNRSENVVKQTPDSSVKMCIETKPDNSLLCEPKDFTADEQRSRTPPSPVPSRGSSLGASSDRSLQNRFFSEKTVSNMRCLIKDNPQGLWASEFPSIYKEYFGVTLDYHAYGYLSMAGVAAAYPDVFICLRRSSADFLLFDMERPLPKHYADSTNTSSYAVVTEVIRSNVERLIAEFPTGLPMGKFKEMYKLYFSDDLNEKKLGFSSIDELLQNLHEEFILRFRKVGNNTLIYPAINLNSVQQEPALCNYEMDDDFIEFDAVYPPDVLGPHDNIPRQPLPHLHQDFPVLVSDVTTPSYFSMICQDCSNKLNSLMDEIQIFYTMEGENYKMPHNTIQQGFLCIAQYNREWHRARICSIKDGLRKIQVLYVDYGTVGFVSSEELRFLHRDFSQLPVQAIPSSLANIEPVLGPKWKREVGKYFLDLVQGKILMAVIDQINEDRVSVGLVDTSGEDDIHINDELVIKGHAKFAFESQHNLSALSTDRSELEYQYSPDLQNNNFERDKWRQDAKSFYEEKFTNGDDSSPTLSTTAGSASNKWKTSLSSADTSKDDRKLHCEMVIADINPCRESENNNCQSGTINSEVSANTNCDKSLCLNSEIGPLPSKEDIMKVWDGQLIMPSQVNTCPSLSSDASLNQKTIPNTWNLPSHTVASSDVSPGKAVEYLTGSDSNNIASKFKNALASDGKESSSYNSMPPHSANTGTKNNHTTVVSDRGQDISATLTQPGMYSQNMWNLGNISITPPWIHSGNNGINDVSSLLQAQQTPWFHTGQTIPQFPLTPIVGISPIPPPGFSSIQNPFVTFPTSHLSAVDPRLSLLNGAFMYPSQSKPWTSRFNRQQPTPNQSSFSNFSGSFFTGHHNAGNLISPAADIREITQSTENLLGVEDCKTASKDTGQGFDSSERTVTNQQSRSCGINQCTQTSSLQNNPQSSGSVNLDNISVTIDNSKIGDNKEVFMALDSSRTDTSVFSADYLEGVSKKENNSITVNTQCNNANDSLYKMSESVECLNSTSKYDVQKTDGSMKVEADCEAKEPANTCSSDSVTKDPEIMTKDSENGLSKTFQRLEIDSSLKTNTPSYCALPQVVQNAVENEKPDDWHSYSTEAANRVEEEITRCVPSQGDDLTIEKKEIQPVRYIRKTLISGKVLNLINYNEQAYFCTDEIVRSFSKFSGRHVLLKILDTTGITLPFVEVNRVDNFEMFEMLDNCDLNTKSRKPNGQIHDVLHLVPLTSATDLLKALKISDVSIFSGIMEEVENFNPEDDYWYRD